MKIDQNTINTLIEKANIAKGKAYVPYSKFHVGAALLTEKGNIYTGCNIENASYGATNCAERTAIFKAVSEGEKKFKAIAITSDHPEFAFPCGICRQVINEFSNDISIILSNNKKEVLEINIKDLLPNSFSKIDLELTKEANDEQ